MAALSDATLTIDTNEMTYIDSHGDSHVVNNAETIVFDLSAGVFYAPKTDDGLICTDGYTLYVEKDPTYSRFLVVTDATAAVWPIAGTLAFIEDASSGGGRVLWDIRSVTIDDIDEPTELTEMVLERRDDPQVTITLTTITMSQ